MGYYKSLSKKYIEYVTVTVLETDLLGAEP